MSTETGPLTGVRVIEFASLAPAPFACTMLADLGAEVLRIDRPGGAARDGHTDPLLRGRSTIEVDLKAPAGSQLARDLTGAADVLVEGFRPGVMERLGLGPQDCMGANPRLIYARMTGWGQSGPLAPRAGHDINYLSIAGGLQPMGRADDTPPPPLNLVADFGGGGMLLALGVITALYERLKSGRGQVVDAAMTDGVAMLTASLHGMLASGAWQAERGANLLDGGAPFYDTYRTADGGFVSVGALEPQFYAELLDGLGLDPAQLPDQHDRAGWPELRRRFSEVFASRDRAHWEEVFADRDACVAPVLSPTEAVDHPHNRARGTFVEIDGLTQPAPAPRLSRTPGRARGHDGAARHPDGLRGWGVAVDRFDELQARGVLNVPAPAGG